MKTIKLTLFFMVLIIAASQASAATIYQIKPSCSKQGGFSMELLTRELPFDLRVQEITVSVYNYETDKQIMFEGEWDNTNTIREGFEANIERFYKTGEMSIFDNGTYQAIVSYPSAKGSGYENLKTDFICPGYYFSCNAMNVSIIECNNKDGEFYATIDGQGLKNHLFSDTARSFDRFKDVKYTLRTKYNYVDMFGTNSARGAFPKDYWLTELSDDIFQVKWINKNNYVESISLKIDNVDECNLHSKYPDTRVSHTLECDIEMTKEDMMGPCPEACEYFDLCLPFGSTFQRNKIPSYCSAEKEIKIQKGLISSCDFDYECTSGSCEDDRCARYSKPEESISKQQVDVPKAEQIEAKTGFFQRLFSWLLK